MKKTLFTSFLLAYGLLCGYAQDQQYVLSVKGKETGLLKVWEEQARNSRTIKVETEVNADLLFLRIDVKYYLESTYKKGVLQKSKATTFVNGKKKKNVRIRLKKGRYRIAKEKEVTFHDHPIHYSGALLYVQEPMETHQVFSEMDGHYKPIQSNRPHHYQLTEPESGRRNEYYYAEGSLEKAVIDHSLMDFKVERKAAE